MKKNVYDFDVRYSFVESVSIVAASMEKARDKLKRRMEADNSGSVCKSYGDMKSEVISERCAYEDDECEQVAYGGKVYELVRVEEVPLVGDVLVAGKSLEKAIMPGLRAGSKVETSIDERVYFYVPDKMLDGTDEEIRKYISENGG